MQRKLISVFICSAGVLLLATAIAKLVSAGGSARILQYPDPILEISFRNVFWIVGITELIIAFVCFLGKRLGLQSVLVAWLATSFLAYRLGLWWSGWQRPCSCLGNLVDAIHISPQVADNVMKGVLTYLLIGSYATLFWLWKQRKKAAPISVTV